MTSIDIPKITTEGLGIPNVVDCAGRLCTPVDPNILIFMNLRQKKTPLDVFRCKGGGHRQGHPGRWAACPRHDREVR